MAAGLVESFGRRSSYKVANMDNIPVDREVLPHTEKLPMSVELVLIFLPCAAMKQSKSPV